MKIYLAAQYNAREEMRGIRDVLNAADHEVTSRWIDNESPGVDRRRMNNTPEECAPFAAADMLDILRADIVAVFTIYGESTTGARHVELGIALGAGKHVAIIGPRENIFQTLPDVRHFSDWRMFARYMMGMPVS